MTYQEITAKICSMLEKAEFENFAVEAENLIIDVLDISRSEFCSRKLMQTQLTNEQESILTEAAERRIIPYPLQYITKRAYFRDLVLHVEPGVLIPRFETEILVDLALKEIPQKGRLLDVGTGSGAIAIACATERKDIDVLAVDISDIALGIARKNAEKYHVENITFRKSDLFSAIDESEKFNVVAANLPYVTFVEYEKLDRQVRDWEPELALTAADDGLQLINRLCDNLNNLLTPDGFAVLEMSPHQTAKVQERLEKLNFNAETVDDYTGRARFVCAKKK